MDCHEEDDYVGCDHCGQLFTKVSHLTHHLHNDHAPKSADGASAGMADSNEEEVDEEVEEEENYEQDAFFNLYREAKEFIRSTDDWRAKYDNRLVVTDENEAIDWVDQEMRPEIIEKAMELYQLQLENSLLLDNGEVHADVCEDLQRYMDKGYGVNKAARLAVRKNHGVIEELLESDDTESDEEETDEDADEEDFE